MTTLHTQFAKRSATSAGKLFKLERCGRYEEALEELSDIWRDFTVFPNVTDFDPQTAAEMLLRCGSLLGFFGHIKQLPGSQDNSKDILTEARSRFIGFDNVEKIAECENYLAISYWRTREFKEAEIWLEESLSHNLPFSSKTRLYTYLIKSMIFTSTEEYQKLIQYFKDLESDFRSYGDAFLNGSLCTNIGISYNELGNYREALRYFELARYFHQKSQHKVYLGTVENNLAQLHKLEKRFTRAHEAIDTATKIFKRIKDKTREGFSFDTKAQIFFAEGKFCEALESIEKAIATLKKSENLGYLVESLTTKTKILLHLENFPAAVFCLFEAVKIAEQQSGEAAAQKLVQDFEKDLQEKNTLPPPQSILQKQPDGEKFELILPVELAHYTDIQGVKINNSHLESVGLFQGSMAIVARENIKRGDLAAISEKETDEVSCGFYDADFGIVCLESKNSEPQLFDENTIEILGKIIGVCDYENSSDGKITVKPIIL
jgi:tetratricopeptide (TPR) repeat protein